MELDEAGLDRLSALGAGMPEPLAAMVLEVEVARDQGDSTGVRKRLFELGIGVVRYGVSVALSRLAWVIGDAAAPGPVAEQLRRAYRLTDGRWCELLRTLRAALEQLDRPSASILRFATGKELQALVSARNRFAHEAGSGDDALARTLSLLDVSGDLTQQTVRVVASLEPALVEVRAGVPRRTGVWRRSPAERRNGLQLGQAYLGEDWTPMTPWMPSVDGGLRLIDAPPSPGRPWRAVVSETGELRAHAPLDEAIRRLAGDDPAAPRVPTDRPSLVGREVAVSLVRRSAEEAVSGGVRVLLLVGPHGAGHSRLLREVVDSAPAIGLPLVLAAFGSRDRRSPLGALRRALRDAGEVPELDAVRAAADRIDTGDALSDRTRADGAIEVVEELLAQASRRRPLLLTIDDAHWLDESSLALLRLLTERATRGASGNLFVLATAQRDPTAARGLSSLIAQIDRDIGSGATRAALDVLDAASIRRIAQAVAPLSSDVERLLVEESGGLPFYVVQPVLVWVETGGLEWREGAWRPRRDDAQQGKSDVLGSAVPGIAQLLEARIGDLYEPGSSAEKTARAMLAMTALHGIPVSYGRFVRVGEAMGWSPETVETILASLVDASLLERRAADGYGFAQPMLARAVATNERGRPWWSRLHRALVEDMERDPSTDPVAIADAYVDLGDSAQALTWSWRGLARRMMQGAFEEARAIAERLANSATDADGRVRAQLALVESLLRGGDPAGASSRLDAIEAGEELSSEVRLARRLAAASVDLGLRRRGTLDESLVRDADTNGDARAAVLARLLVASSVRGSQAMPLVREAISASDGVPGMQDLRYRVLALDLELRYEERNGHVADLQDAASRARAAARALGSAWAELDVLNDASVLEADAGRHERALDGLATVAEQARAAGLGSIRRTALVNGATVALRASRAAQARELARTAATEARDVGEVKLLAMALSVLSEAEANLGDTKKALEAVDESIALREGWLDPGISVALLRRADLQSSWELGMGDAQRALDRAVASGNVDLQARANLWLACGAAREDRPGSRAALRDLVTDLQTRVLQLRPATLERLKQAETMLDETRL